MTSAMQGIGYLIGLILTGVLAGLAVGAHLVHYLERREIGQRARSLVIRSAEARSFLLELGARFDASASGQRLAQRLEAADLSLRPHEVLALQAFAVFVVLYLNALFLNLSFFLVLSLALFAVRFATGRYLAHRARQRAIRFAEQLPDVADALARGLGAGQTIVQAIGEAADRLPPPASGGLRKVYQQLLLGYPLHEALEHLYRLYPSADLELMITVILAQQRAGGNLTRVLQRLAITMAERRSMQREIRALTEEPRFSAILVIALPIAFLILFRALMPGMIDALITQPLGWVILGFSLALQIGGFLLIRRITHVEV
jgi:tight adherence protein B